MEKSLVSITDSTLSDWQDQLARFGGADAACIADALQSAGIDTVEVRVSWTQLDVMEAAHAVRRVLDRATTLGACQNERDIDAAARCGLAAVVVALPLSDRRIREGLNGGRSGTTKRLSRLIEHGRARRLTVGVLGEDASRADPAFVQQILSVSRSAGATSFCFVDTYGVMETFGVYTTFRRLRAATDLRLEFRAGNDLGLAAANTVAAVQAGAAAVRTRSFALGAGSADDRTAQEVVSALRGMPQVDVRVDLARLAAAADLTIELARTAVRRGRSTRRTATTRAARCP